MGQSRQRRFTVLDAIILIAAVGIGLAWMRAFTETEAGFESYPYPNEINFRNQPIPAPVRVILLGFWYVNAFYNIAAPVAIAMIVLRVFPTRPMFRHLTRQPGVVACCAIVVAVGVDTLACLSDVVVTIRYQGHGWSDIASSTYWNINGPSESLAVFVAWLLLAMSGRWKPERSWVDRFGRVLGVFWLVSPPLEWFVTRIVIASIWLP